MDDYTKRILRELAHSLQTIYFYYNKQWLNVDRLEGYIADDNLGGAEEYLKWLREKVFHELNHDTQYPYNFSS